MYRKPYAQVKSSVVGSEFQRRWRGVGGACQGPFSSWLTCSCSLPTGGAAPGQLGDKCSACKAALGRLSVTAQNTSRTAAFLLSLLPLSVGSAWIPTHSLCRDKSTYLAFSLRLPSLINSCLVLTCFSFPAKSCWPRT